jgi:putative ABC transport system substrate-binding protein
MGNAESDVGAKGSIVEFRRELRRLGWTEGDNILIDERWAADDMGRVRAYAAELVSAPSDVILVTAARVVSAVQRATHAIPIVFVGISDPVGAGFVASLARPAGNVTGFSGIEYSVVGKLLETLKQIAPAVTRVAHIFNPDNPSSGAYFRSVEAAALSLGVAPIATPVHEPADIERAIAAVAREPSGGLLLSPDATNNLYRDLIINLASRHRLPAVSSSRAFVTGGGLISYGVVQVPTSSSARPATSTAF